MEFLLLGPLEVRADGRSLELGPPQQRALLSILLLHANEVVSTERLTDALWPTDPPKSASKAIHVYVSALRKAFGDERDALETRVSGYRLHVSPGQLDLHEFERLLAKARGEDPVGRAATLATALALTEAHPRARAECRRVLAALGLSRERAIPGSYSDLLSAKHRPPL